MGQQIIKFSTFNCVIIPKNKHKLARKKITFTSTKQHFLLIHITRWVIHCSIFNEPIVLTDVELIRISGMYINESLTQWIQIVWSFIWNKYLNAIIRVIPQDQLTIVQRIATTFGEHRQLWSYRLSNKRNTWRAVEWHGVKFRLWRLKLLLL